MTDTPIALTNVPQFSADWWKKVPRQMVKSKIARITQRDNGFTEIALVNGVAFQRQRAEIKQLLTANLDVHVEILGQGEIVTGLFVPNIGWAFRMSNDDLAEYAKGIAAAEHNRRVKLRERMVDHVELALEMDLARQIGEYEALPDRYAEWIDVRALATRAIKALEDGPKDE